MATATKRDVFSKSIPVWNSVLEYHSPQKSWTMRRALMAMSGKTGVEAGHVVDFAEVGSTDLPRCNAAYVEVEKPRHKAAKETLPQPSKSCPR